MNAVIKWSSLQKSVNIFMPKKFYEINTRPVLEWRTWKVLHLDRLWSYTQTLD